MEDNALEFVLAVSPVLEILTVTGSLNPLRARLTSHSLRSAQVCLSILEEVAVVDAPSLERLFLWSNWSERRVSTTVKIGHSPKLRVLGSLEPGVQMLQIGNTIIKVRAAPCPLLSQIAFLFHDIDGTRSSQCEATSQMLTGNNVLKLSLPRHVLSKISKNE